MLFHYDPPSDLTTAARHTTMTTLGLIPTTQSEPLQLVLAENNTSAPVCRSSSPRNHNMTQDVGFPEHRPTV
ncbi:hypothetical protein HGRIS_001140 [Hohenbuehelia grisea]|uniref:Uncharacterized protein n=1 Tax=Hohenbuehelia grisea TaxID=104357 RepID=A0ABR3JPR3_9AGAR